VMLLRLENVFGLNLILSVVKSIWSDVVFL
jgi:hypothetical protein